MLISLKPAIAVQNALPPAQIPVSLAILMFTQNLAASVFFAIATTIFTETLVDKLGEYAPSVAPEEALKAGGSAGAVRALVPPGSLELHGVLTSYAKACDAVFIMLAALAAVAFVSTWGMGWKNVSKTESKSDRAEKQEKHAG
jgi:nitrate/nitrite transporter NarK